MGSACVFFSISPTRALLSDLNAELVSTFDAVRKHPDQIYSSLIGMPKGADSYYTIRKQNPNSLNIIERAVRFIYLNRFCFNGIYRTNLRGEFNVPFASSKTGDFPSWDEFFRSAQRLRNVDLRCGDFASIVSSEVGKGDFIYLDPPYAVKNSRVFRQYGPATFGLDDLGRLREVLETINSTGALFLLSYANCEEAKQLSRDWNSINVEVQRNVAGFAKHRRRAAELLISNFVCNPLKNSKNV